MRPAPLSIFFIVGVQKSGLPWSRMGEYQRDRGFFLQRRDFSPLRVAAAAVSGGSATFGQIPCSAAGASNEIMDHPSFYKKTSTSPFVSNGFF